MAARSSVGHMLLVLCALLGAKSVAAAEPASQSFVVADFGDTAPIHIDGVVDEAWSAAPVNSDFTQYHPRIGEPAAVRTSFRIARDARYLYVIAVLFDPDISRLRSGYTRRDGYRDEQDWFQILIDPLGTRRVAQELTVNPFGVIRDGLWNDDTGSFNDAADFEFEAATRIETDSWVVEMRIPFTELRYDSTSADDWNILVRRNMPRIDRRAMSSPSVSAASCLVCFAAPLRGLVQLPVPRSLELVPQILSLYRGAPDRIAAFEGQLDIEPALDLKYRVSPSTVVDATLNPDFSQLELDTAQLAFNLRFAVSQPEKRPFFVEGLDILDSPLAAIYTRSITDPAWGVRATHRGRWDGVLITSLDDGGGLVLLPNAFGSSAAPQDFSSQATIGRVRLPLENLTLGALVTDRRNGGEHNTVAGPDVVWFPTAKTRVRAQVLASRTTGEESIPAAGDERTASGRGLSVEWLRETRHWYSELEYQRLDREFRADDGFIPQAGIRALSGALQYKFLELPVVSELAPYVGGDFREDLTGERVSEASRVGVQAHFSRNSVFTAELRPKQSTRLRPGAQLHSARQGMISISSSPAERIASVGLVATVGETLDVVTDRVASGESLTASALFRPAPTWEIEPRLELAARRTDLEKTAPLYQANERAAQLRTTVQLSSRNRLRLVLQSTSVERKDREAGVQLVDKSTFTGSFLFTHERSLLSRLYAGISFASNTAGAPSGSDQMEVFVKLQTAISPLRTSMD